MLLQDGINHFASFAAELFTIQADLPGNAGLPTMITGCHGWCGYVNWPHIFLELVKTSSP